MKVLIVGATSGIGYYTALMLYKRGHEVIITTHTEKEKEYLKRKIKSKKIDMDVYKLDVCNDNDINLLDKINYDVIWLNQAIGIGGAILSVKKEKIKEIYETNVFGTIFCLQKAYNNMAKRSINGKMIVTSSLIADFDLKYLGMYASTKAAINEICYTIDKELKEIKSNISITVLQLGAYHTGFNQVMIDNKETSTYKNNQFYRYNNRVTIKQKLLFSLIEKYKYDDIAYEIIKIIENNNKKLKIRRPRIMGVIGKIYQIIKH